MERLGVGWAVRINVLWSRKGKRNTSVRERWITELYLKASIGRGWGKWKEHWNKDGYGLKKTGLEEWNGIQPALFWPPVRDTGQCRYARGHSEHQLAPLTRESTLAHTGGQCWLFPARPAFCLGCSWGCGPAAPVIPSMTPTKRRDGAMRRQAGL